MQEWIIAMLVISVLLVLRDMAKVFFRGRSFLKAEQPAEEKNPQTCDEICSHCYQREICWGTQSQEMYRGSERMIRSMEEGN